jgi:hypothetical protein
VESNCRLDLLRLVSTSSIDCLRSWFVSVPSSAIGVRERKQSVSVTADVLG